MSAPGSSSLFVRQSSGLVRNVSVTNALFFNVAAFVGVGLDALSDLLLAWLRPGLDIRRAFASTRGRRSSPGSSASILALIFASLTSVMPRSGGDYVFTSRIVHPFLGWLESWTLVFASVADHRVRGPARAAQPPDHRPHHRHRRRRPLLQRMRTPGSPTRPARSPAARVHRLARGPGADHRRRRASCRRGRSTAWSPALAGLRRRRRSSRCSSSVCSRPAARTFEQQPAAVHRRRDRREDRRVRARPTSCRATTPSLLQRDLLDDGLPVHAGRSCCSSSSASSTRRTSPARCAATSAAASLIALLGALADRRPRELALRRRDLESPRLRHERELGRELLGLQREPPAPAAGPAELDAAARAVSRTTGLWPIWTLISLAGTIFPFLLCPVYINFISRMQLAWSLDRQVPEWFGRVNERLRAPLNAISRRSG